MSNYPINEHVHSINGVNGRMCTIHEPREVRGNLVHLSQKWVSEARPVDGYGTDGVMHAEIRFDDECKNGHQSFSITASVYTRESRRQRDIAAGGCMHEEIENVFPELAPLSKWHLMSTDGPMHYVANTVYHAGDLDHNGRRAGEPSAWRTVIYFGACTVAHRIEDKFARFIQDRVGSGTFQVAARAHDNEKPGAYQFEPKYTLVGYGEKWHECPFDDEATAQEWAAALNNGTVCFRQIATSYSEGKTRDLNAARSVAVWPEATDEQLSAEPEELKAALLARLPQLVADFRADMERIGFLWGP